MKVVSRNPSPRRPGQERQYSVDGPSTQGGFLDQPQRRRPRRSLAPRAIVVGSRLVHAVQLASSGKGPQILDRCRYGNSLERFAERTDRSIVPTRLRRSQTASRQSQDNQCRRFRRMFVEVQLAQQLTAAVRGATTSPASCWPLARTTSVARRPRTTISGSVWQPSLSRVR